MICSAVHQTVTVRRLVQSHAVQLEGRPCTQDSWFPGYAWTIAYCGRCYNHLGWRFTLANDNSGHQSDDNEDDDSDNLDNDDEDSDGDDEHQDASGDEEGADENEFNEDEEDGSYEMSYEGDRDPLESSASSS